MSTPVNPSQLELYILGELDDAASAEVERLVAEDPAWAAALQAEAQLEMAVFEVADAAPSPVAESVAAAVKAPSPSFGERLWRTLFGPAGLGLAVAAMAAALVVFSGPTSTVDLPPYQLEINAGEAVVRSAPKPGPQGVPTYTRGSTLSMVVRPQTRVIASPQVDVLLDGAPLVGVKLDHLDGGTVEISGVFSEDLVEPTPGEHRLLVRVGGQELAQTFVWKQPSP